MIYMYNNKNTSLTNHTEMAGGHSAGNEKTGNFIKNNQS